MEKSPFPILVVEDIPEDVWLLRRAFESAGLEHPLYVVSDGEQAIAYLQGAEQYADRKKYPLPKLILLDIKMPRKGGFEVLSWLRTNGEIRRIPVVMISASPDPQDINKAYELGANAYMVKPVEFKALETLVKTISEFWTLGETPEVSDAD